MPIARRRRSCLGAALILAVATAAGAQPEPLPDSDSYVDVSLEATEALGRAESEAAEGRWAAAAAAYHGAAEKFGRHLVQAEPGLFINVRDAVNARIGKWPAAGLAAYRASFETPARAALRRARPSGPTASTDAAGGEAAGDARTQLIHVADSYFCTSAGAEALEAAAELDLERGEVHAAWRAFEGLAARHPDRERRGPAWRLKAAFARALAGDVAALEGLAREFSADASPSITWEGRPQPVGLAARAMLERIVASPESVAAHEDAAWPGVFMGGARRTGRFDVDVNTEARLWRGPLGDASGAAADGAAAGDEELARNRDQAQQRAIRSGRMLAFEPVFGDGRLYCRDRTRVWALDPRSPDRPVWQFALDGEAPMSDWTGEDDPPRQFTLLFHEGQVIAPLDRQVLSSQDETRDAASLVCLDAATGRVVWRNDLSDLASPFEDLVMDGAPVPARDRLYGLVRRRKPFGFESCYLVCFHARSGELMWQTHIGEAPTGSYGYYRPTHAHPAAWGNLVVAHTNLGTVAAVDGDTGRVAWLRTYASRWARGPDVGWPAQSGRGSRAWHFSPTMIWRDKAVTYPLDADDALVINVLDGRLHAAIGSKALQDADGLIGIAGDLLYAAGSSIVAWDLARGSEAWHRPLAVGEWFGRGAVIRGGVLVPTTHALASYPLDGGPPKLTPWPLDGAGNLLPLSDQLVVAASRELYGLVGRQAAFDRLTARLEERPSDPAAALALAELAFETGEFERGLQAVEEARRRMGEVDAVDGAARRDLCRRLLSFSRIAGESSRPSVTPRDRLNTSIALLEMAVGVAPDEESALGCRLLLARDRLALFEPARAIEVYQSVLENPGLRTRMFLFRPEYDPDVSGLAAAQLEERAPEPAVVRIAAWIDAIVGRFGADAYAEIEARAAARLAGALERQDLEAMREVCEAFPNSAVRGDAWLALARGLRERPTAGAGPGAALRAYRRACQALHGVARAAVIAELAAALEAAGQSAEAAVWLDRGARDFPDFHFERGGRTMRFADALAELGIDPAGLPPPPRLTPPLKAGYRRLHAERTLVLDPLHAGQPATCWDALLTFAGGALEARHARDNRDLWPTTQPCDDQPMLLGMDDARFVLATAHRLFAVSRADGRPQWWAGRRPAKDPRTDPEEHAVWTDHVLLPRRLFAASDRGEVVCIDVEDGRVLWRRQAGGGADHLAADDRHVYYSQWKGRFPSVHVLRADDGEPAGAIHPEEPRPFQALAPTADGRLLVVLSRTILCVEPADGRVVWRVATAGHFSMSSFQMDEDGLYISDDSRTVAKYDLASGLLLWRTPGIGGDLRDGLWTGMHRGHLYAASRDALMAFDTVDGRMRWSAADPPGLAAQPPQVTSAGLLCVTEVPPERHRQEESDSAAEDGKAAAPLMLHPRYRIRLFDLLSGQELQAAPDGPLLTEPVETFRGVYVRDGAIAVVDGSRLIVYTDGGE